MRTPALSFALALSLVGNVAAKGITEESLVPSTPWHLDSTKDGCSLRRGFGNEANPLVIQFDRFDISDKFGIILLGSRLRGWQPPRKISIRYEDGGRVQELEKYSAGTLGDGTPIILLSTWPASDQPSNSPANPVTHEVEAAVTKIELRYHDKRISLDSGALRSPFDQLRSCTDQALTVLGVDPEKLRNASRRAKPDNPASWATSTDYRNFAGSSGNSATVNFRLLVGTEGQVTGCSIRNSYPNNHFDEITCRLLLKRVHFISALDAGGNPIPDLYTNKVRWGSFGN